MIEGGAVENGAQRTPRGDARIVHRLDAVGQLFEVCKAAGSVGTGVLEHLAGDRADQGGGAHGLVGPAFEGRAQTGKRGVLAGEDLTVGLLIAAGASVREATHDGCSDDSSKIFRPRNSAPIMS